MPERKSSLQPVAVGLTVLAALLRLAPHPPNFTPVGSVALFGGARLRGWQAYLVPLLAMVVTDPILSHMRGYPAYSEGTVVVYAALLVNVLLGQIFLQQSNSAWRIGLVAVACSVQFFLVTNFFVWVGAGVSLYPHTLAGLAACYVEGLPFFARTLAADLFYSAVLFSAYALVSSRLEHRTASR